MTFTLNEILALEAIKEHIDHEPELDPFSFDEANVNWYVTQGRKCLEMALNYYFMVETVNAPDYKEKKEQLRLAEIERQRQKMAARSLEVRENLVSGILSGLIPKARRAGSVDFEITDWFIEIDVWKDGKRVFNLSYDREDGSMDAYLNGKHLEQEDWTVLGGNMRPRDQSVALNAVLEYLESLM